MSLISIVIPVYNAAPYLELAVRSVLHQNVPLEIIIVDDGSTDESAVIARRLAAAHEEITLIEQENRGVSAARNVGIARARGKFFGFLDADDEYTQGALEFLARELELLRRERGELAMVFGDVRYLWLCPSESIWKPEGEVAEACMMGLTCVTRAALETVGGFDEELRGFEDMDWQLRAQDGGVAVKKHERVVLLYRQHLTNITRNLELMASERNNALRKNVRRRIARRKTKIPI